MNIPTNLFKVQLNEKNASSADTEDEEEIEQLEEADEEDKEERITKKVSTPQETLVQKVAEVEEKTMSIKVHFNILMHCKYLKSSP